MFFDFLTVLKCFHCFISFIFLRFFVFTFVSFHFLLSFFFLLAFLSIFKSSSDSGKSKVTRVTVGRDIHQPTKVFEFVKLILRPSESQSRQLQICILLFIFLLIFISSLISSFFSSLLSHVSLLLPLLLFSLFSLFSLISDVSLFPFSSQISLSLLSLSLL